MTIYAWALAGAFLFLAFRYWRRSRALEAGLRTMAQVVGQMRRGEYPFRPLARPGEPEEVLEVYRQVDALAESLQDLVIEVEEARTRWQTITTHMEEGIIILDRRKRVVMMNPSARRIFDLPDEGAAGEGTVGEGPVGRHLLEITRHFQLEDAADQVLKGEGPLTREFSQALPEEKNLEVHLAPLGNPGGEPTGILMVIRDITRFRRLERVRSDFVANVSHELQTPLTSIRGFAETLIDGALDDPATSRRFVGIIHDEASRLTRLIDDLLDLSRLESGRTPMRRRRTDVVALAVKVAESLDGRVQQAGLRMEVAFPPHFPEVLADPDQILQVMVNLVGNSLKYTPVGGRISIEGQDHGDHVVVTVRDTGVGIPRADLPRIFERFYRVDKARTRASGGTGLGLAISKHIVEAHGGKIWAESEPGRGTAISFTLPKVDSVKP